MSFEEVFRRREAEREAHLESAGRFVEGLQLALGVEAAVVFGSVARGDFNLWSDVDLLIVAAHLPERWLERCEILGERPAGVQPIAWTPREWRQQRSRRNPIAMEAAARGIWLIGSLEALDRGA